MEALSQYESLLNAAHLGIEAKNFIKSTLGRYLIKKIDDQVTDALHRLRNADPHLPYEIQAIQNEIKIAEASKYFLLEAVHEGYNCQRLIEENEMEQTNYRLSDFDDQPITGEEEWK